MAQVLSLDWDFFTGDCYYEDACCGWACGDGNPYARGRGSVYPDRMYMVPWVLDHITGIGELIVAECHASQLAFLRRGDECLVLDDHEDYDAVTRPALACFGEDTRMYPGVVIDPDKDLGQLLRMNNARVTCANWGAWASLGGVRVFHCFSGVRQDGHAGAELVEDVEGFLPRYAYINNTRPPQSYDTVFVCRSSPWTPREKDYDFNKLIHALSVHTGDKVRFYGHRGALLRRSFEAYLRRWKTKEVPHVEG